MWKTFADILTRTPDTALYGLIGLPKISNHKMDSVVYQGPDSQNKRHQGSHFFQLQGVFKACSTPTLKGYEMLFYRDKDVEGVTFMNWPVIHLSSDIVKFYVAEGVEFSN